MRLITAKLILLISYVALVSTIIWLPGHDIVAAGIMAVFLLVVGLASLNRTFAITGNREGPGFLFILSLLWLVGPICYLELLPYDLYTYGISIRPHPITSEAILLDLLFGIFMTVCMWIPYIGYCALDRVLAPRPVHAGKK